jgi:hypothetical protein
MGQATSEVLGATIHRFVREKKVEVKTDEYGSVSFPFLRGGRGKGLPWGEIVSIIFEQLKKDEAPGGSIADMLLKRYGSDAPLRGHFVSIWQIWINKSRISAEEWNSFATLSPWKYASTVAPSVGRLSAYAVAHTIRLDEGEDIVPPEISAWLKNADPPSTVRKIEYQGRWWSKKERIKSRAG